MSSFELVIPGPPRGKGRPRFANGRTFTDAKTAGMEELVRQVWLEAGRPRLEGPLALKLELHVARPKSHYRTNGELSALGVRTLWPVRKPDVDNALKLVADALNGLAYQDDVQIVAAYVRRYWATEPQTVLRLRETG